MSPPAGSPPKKDFSIAIIVVVLIHVGIGLAIFLRPSSAVTTATVDLHLRPATAVDRTCLRDALRPLNATELTGRFGSAQGAPRYTWSVNPEGGRNAHWPTQLVSTWSELDGEHLRITVSEQRPMSPPTEADWRGGESATRRVLQQLQACALEGVPSTCQRVLQIRGTEERRPCFAG